MTASTRSVCTCLSAFLAVVGLLAPACGDDSSPGGSGGSTGGSTTDPGGSSTTDDDLSTSSSSGSGPAESSSSGEAVDSSSSGTLPDSVSLGGQVTDFVGIVGIEGLSVSLDILDDGSVTTDADGMFTFEALPLDTPVNIIFEPLPDGTPAYAGGIVPERTGTMDREDVTAQVVQGPFIEAQLASLADQDPEPPDLGMAILVAQVDPGVIASGTVTVSFDPAPPEGTYYAPSETGAPVLNSTEIGFATLPAAVVFNLADTAAGDITITAEHSGGLTCTVRHPHFFTQGGYITQVTIDCA